MTYKVTHHKNGNTTIRITKDKSEPKPKKQRQSKVNVDVDNNPIKLDMFDIEVCRTMLPNDGKRPIKCVYAKSKLTGIPLLKNYPDAIKACEADPTLPKEIPSVPKVGNLEILYKQKLITKSMYETLFFNEFK